MSSSEERIQERRKHKRHKVKEGAFVINSTNFGRIIDISEGGIAFTYPSSDDKPTETFAIDIIFGGKDFLENVPFQKKSDLVLEDNLFSTPLITMRRCGAEFCDLNDEQQQKLIEFIKNHAIQVD